MSDKLEFVKSKIESRYNIFNMVLLTNIAITGIFKAEFLTLYVCRHLNDNN